MPIGVYVRSKECRLILSLAKKGKQVHPNTIEAMRQANLGKIPTIETRDKIRLRLKGRKCTLEHRSAISNGKIKYPGTNNRDRWLKRTYGITEDQYLSILKKQNGVCAICNKPEINTRKNGTVKKLAVDHNHKTQVVRGLLCDKCNRGLGHFNDDCKLLESAMKYLNPRK